MKKLKYFKLNKMKIYRIEKTEYSNVLNSFITLMEMAISCR